MLPRRGSSGPGNGAAGVVQQACAIRVLENQGPVVATEVAVVAAQRGDLYDVSAAGSRPISR